MNFLYLFICAYFSSVIASISGVGGGGLLVPLFVLLGDVDIKQAVVLSIMTIVGNSFVRALYYFSKRHKNCKIRYLPDYNIVRLVVLFDGNTAYLGFLLNDILPEIVITIGIIIILSVLTFKTVQKAIDYFRHKPVVDSIFITIDNIDYKLPTTKEVDNTEGLVGETKLDLVNGLIYSLFSFGLLSFLTIIRKSTDRPWVIYLTQVGLVGMLSYITANHIHQIYENRRIQKFNFIEGDIIWNKINFMKYAVVGSIVGMVSTLLGIGGGMIMNPVMINLKVLPEVVVATSSITSFFSAVISATQFIVSDSKVEWYHGVLVGIGAFGALTGLVILKFFNKNIRFVITCVLSVTMIASTVMLVVVSIMK